MLTDTSSDEVTARDANEGGLLDGARGARIAVAAHLGRIVEVIARRADPLIAQESGIRSRKVAWSGGPGLRIHDGIVDRDLVRKRLIVDASEALDEMQLVAMWMPDRVEPRPLVDADRVDNQCVTVLVAADRMSQVLRIRIVRMLGVQPNDAECRTGLVEDIDSLGGLYESGLARIVEHADEAERLAVTVTRVGGTLKISISAGSRHLGHHRLQRLGTIGYVVLFASLVAWRIRPADAP